tara:strand:- start:76 stop:636 length:561 start_codon:yes stop_codon:yes gene_type:complete
MLNKVKLKKNIFSKEQCEQIIKSQTGYEYDTVTNSPGDNINAFMSKEEIDMFIVEDNDGDYKRKVSQSGTDVVTEWDGLPVYRCKIMKYEEGEFVAEHVDSQWMCQSNYWAPGTNKVAKDLMIVPLNDDYEGGQLTVEGVNIPQEIGSVIQMPQSGNISLDIPRPHHGVSTITKGTRYSMVFWNFE